MSRILICPYCGDEKNRDELGCCGESSAHFEWIESDAEEKTEPQAESMAEANKIMRSVTYGN